MDLLPLLIWLFLAGLLVGVLARLIVRDTAGLGLLATSLAGVAGSLLGGLITRYLVDPREDWVSIAIAVGCAALVVAFLASRR